jgi:hypothetical protein
VGNGLRKEIPQGLQIHRMQSLKLGNCHALVDLVDRAIADAKFDHFGTHRCDEAAIGCPASRRECGWLARNNAYRFADRT